MKEKIITCSFVGILFIFPICGLFIKDLDISSYERRKLTTFFDLKDNFVDNLDDYLSDQFPGRNFLISSNSVFDRYILGNIDSNDVYIKDGFVIDKNYPINDKNVDGFIEKMNYINENYLEDSNVFYTIIPDKGYFLDDSKYLKLDYDDMYSRLEKGIKISYIDVKTLLMLDDYYRTDIHIKQENYFKVIKKIVSSFDLEYRDFNYEETVFDDFYGASYSKIPAFMKPDKLKILSNNIIDSVKVKHLEYKDSSVYDMNKVSSSDLYNIYLSGPSSLIEIDNDNATSERELIIFRDSFASSFAPLLVPYYKKITLIDLRYMKMDLVNNYVDFNNKDVLFSYSTLIVNDSNILRVNTK